MDAGRPAGEDVTAGGTRLRLLVPEVVQTSAMDCGPATLKCVLEGLGIPVSYGRLREACQTEVDGSSIDTIEEVAVALGVDAEQILLPVDHLLLSEAKALPAIVVSRLPDGSTHFVVAWRRHGSLLQVMDPGTGRRWPTAARFLEEVYVHRMPVAAAAWRAWAGSEAFTGPLARRLAALGVGRSDGARLIERAIADPGIGSLAALDAATRAVARLAHGGALPRGGSARRLLERFFERARDGAPGAGGVLPEGSWSVQERARGAGEEPQLLVRGAVLVRIHGRRGDAGPAESASASAQRRPEVAGRAGSRGTGSEADEPLGQNGATELARSAAQAPRPPREAGPGPRAPLPDVLADALAEPPSRPFRELARRLAAGGWTPLLAVGAALLLASLGVAVETLLFRGLLDLGAILGPSSQRLQAAAGLVAFLCVLLLIELPVSSQLLRLGRALEARLRSEFLVKVPRLGDRYFSSRLSSDMADRCHGASRLRLFPELIGAQLRAGAELVITTSALIWLDPGLAPLALLAAAVSLALPLLAQKVLAERDLRAQVHSAALGRIYLDALLGLTPIRAHGAETAVRRQHDRQLGSWASASLALLRASVAVDGLVFVAGFGLAAWILLDHVARRGEAGGVLLLVYWALALPALGQTLASGLQQSSSQRNTTLRLLEPLGARPEDESEEPAVAEKVAAPARPIGASRSPLTRAAAPTRGVELAFEGVLVRASGHTILEDIELAIAAGSHVALVGPSGAGKSSLVGLLLGWHRPEAGRVRVDGRPLDGRRQARLRRETAWVDPAVAIWNRSLLDNLVYGAPREGLESIGGVLEAAALGSVVERLAEGLQTRLGEAGGLISGGEGQRVRFGRALLRREVRLAILDEPFRGLERGRRGELLARARRCWRDSTLVCITHDIHETLAFARVVVLERGRIVEDGEPRALAARSGSRYRALLEAEVEVREKLWSADVWRRVRLDHGRLAGDPAGGP